MGGTEKQVVLLARGLHERGIDTSVWVLSGGPETCHEDALRRDGIRVVNMGLRRFRDPFQAPPNFIRLGAMTMRLRRERPDIVHAFLFRSYVLGAPVARMARIPVFVAGLRSLGDFKENRPAALAAERLATRITDLIIANAEAVAADTKRRERVGGGQVEVVYNGLPEQAFAAVSPADVETAIPVVLCVANLRQCKGHRYLLEAMGRLQRDGRPCTLLLAGDGQERQSLERQAAGLRIDVRFLGQCHDVRPLLARADVVAHPSLTEGMSNAVMEGDGSRAGRWWHRPWAAHPNCSPTAGPAGAASRPGSLAEAIGRRPDRHGAGHPAGARGEEWSRAHLSARRPWWTGTFDLQRAGGAPVCGIAG